MLGPTVMRTLLDAFEDPLDYKVIGCKAYCTSEDCIGVRFVGSLIREAMMIKKGSTGIRKRVDKTAVYCPDCGHALIWRPILKEVKKKFNWSEEA